MDNFVFYNELREVPKEAQKEFNNGRFKGTDINPMWRIKKMTETFGPCGLGWYFGEPRFEVREDGGVTTVHCTLPLYIKNNGEWSAPIYGVGGNTLMSAKGGVSDEAYKMAYTDAQSNATKLLGLGADVWFANDRTKYTSQQPQHTIGVVEKSSLAQAIADAKDIATLTNLWNQMNQQEKDLHRDAVAKKSKEIKSNEL